MNILRVTADFLARLMAVLGGMLLLFLTIMTCVSIAGRGLNTIGNMPFMESGFQPLAGFLKQFSPVTGDFELVEMGMALVIFLFLPWCQLTRGHASVDLFTARLLSLRANEYLALLWEVLLLVITIVITWRLYVGMQDMMAYNETTFLLQWPVWWGYAACVIAGVGVVITGAMSVIIHWAERHDTIISSRQAGP